MAGFAKYLYDEYVIEEGSRNEGRFLALGSQLDYVGALVNLAAARFKATGSAELREFFTMLDPKSNSDSAVYGLTYLGHLGGPLR